ncbi:hypothetical protein BN1013_02216 [Candidatus Rubidus massiliensis]|nr:hypothetical protein BN1013_02216 [Candidatus Rubidus massiliensis]
MNNFVFSDLEYALMILGQLLEERKLNYQIVVIGGGGLLLLGLMIRTTKDLDLVALVDNNEFISAKPLPKNLVKAIEDVAMALNISKDWINVGPSDLFSLGLPQGFKSRMITKQYGGLTVHLAERFDQICFKLYASVDQGPTSKHYKDLQNLKPLKQELEAAKNWCITHDTSEPFYVEIKAVVDELNKLNEK